MASYDEKEHVHCARGHNCMDDGACCSSSKLRQRRAVAGENSHLGGHSESALTPLLHISPNGGLHLGLLRDDATMECFDVSNSCCLGVEDKKNLIQDIYDASDQASCDCSSGPKRRKCSDADRICFQEISWDTLMTKRVDNTTSCHSPLLTAQDAQATQSAWLEQHTETIQTAWGAIYYIANTAIKDQFLGSPIRKKRQVFVSIFRCDGICCASEVPIIKDTVYRSASKAEIILKVHVTVIRKRVTIEHTAGVSPDKICTNLAKAGLAPTLISTNMPQKAIDNKEIVIDVRSGVEDSIRSHEPKTLLESLPERQYIFALLFYLVSLFSIIDGAAHLKYFAVVAIALSWWPKIALRAYTSIRRRTLDINLLMTGAVFGAIAIGDYVEGATLMVLFSWSDWLERQATERVRAAISDIVALSPDIAYVGDNGVPTPVEDVAIGTTVIVKPGEKVPIDGVVIFGSSTVDQSMLTGESRPVHKRIGEDVSGGTINVGNSFLKVQTTVLSSDSAVARLARLVEEAQAKTSPTENLVETIAKYYTPIVFGGAILLGSIPWAWGPEVGMKFLYDALVLLVIACPCALVISTPLTYVCALAQGARNGILIKGGIHLETLSQVSAVAVDKTGTVTEGSFAVTGIKILSRTTNEDEILKCVLSMERQANHPIAEALCKYCTSFQQKHYGAVTAYENVDAFESIAGEGVKGVVNGKSIEIGNRRMAGRACTDPMSFVPGEWMQRGGTVGWVMIDADVAAVFILSDTVRATAAEAIVDLNAIGVTVTMLTGDSKDAALAAAQCIRIPQVFYELLPEEKVKHVERLKLQCGTETSKQWSCMVKKRGGVAMVGDGVNDAPALATANIGIAMGVQGTAVAMETADVSLMDNDLRKIAFGICLGRQVTSVIFQNVVFAMLCKAVMISLAVSGLSPLWLAIVVDVGSMLLVSLNSSRILKPVRKVPVGKDDAEAENTAEVDGVGSSVDVSCKLDDRQSIQDEETLTLKIDEMEGLCDANLLQRAIKKIEGVRHVDIDLVNKTLDCQYVRGTCEISSLVSCAESLGFDVDYNVNYCLKIEEMEGVCDANLLRSALRKLSYVLQIDVDVGIKTLNCMCSGANCNFKELAGVINGLGFDYELVR